MDITPKKVAEDAGAELLQTNCLSPSCTLEHYPARDSSLTPVILQNIEGIQDLVNRAWPK